MPEELRAKVQALLDIETAGSPAKVRRAIEIAWARGYQSVIGLYECARCIIIFEADDLFD